MFVSERELTRHKNRGKTTRSEQQGCSGAGTHRKNDAQSGRRADGRTEHSEARTALLLTQRSKSAKWSFSNYSHGCVVVLRCDYVTTTYTAYKRCDMSLERVKDRQLFVSEGGMAAEIIK